MEEDEICTLYIRPEIDVLVLSPSDSLSMKDGNFDCPSTFKWENIVSVKTSEDEQSEEFHQQGSKYKITLLYYELRLKSTVEHNFYFERESEFHIA
jgi:hypothetical protein